MSYKKEKFTEDNRLADAKTPKKCSTDKKDRNEINHYESREDESMNIGLEKTKLLISLLKITINLRKE